MAITVGVLGATGYTGAELLRLLARHPGVELSWITSEKFAGERIDLVFPGFKGILDLSCQSISKLSGFPRVDVVFSCLPEGTSMHFVSRVLDRGARVIDLSADFRLGGARRYRGVYGKEHPMPALLEEAVYGLPELRRASVRGARLVANPGCYATAALLGLAPLAMEGLMAGGRAFVDAKAGVSGAGRAPRLGSHFVEVNESVSTDSEVGVDQRQEIEERLGELAAKPLGITFVTHRLPISRGILTTIYVGLVPEKGEHNLEETFATFYGSEPFVRVLPRGRMPALKHVTYSNYADIGALVQEKAAVVSVALDNLGKGASGQAVQNMNLMFGFPEGGGAWGEVVFP